MAGVLLVVADPGTLTTDDQWVSSRLAGLGHAVTPADEDSPVADTSPYDLIVLGPSTTNHIVRGDYDAQDAPVMALSAGSMPDLGIQSVNFPSGGSGSASVWCEDHEINDPLVGTSTIYSSSQSTWFYTDTNLASGVEILARSGDGSNRVLAGCVDVGSDLTSGTATHRILWLALRVPSAVNAAGGLWFDRGVAWALGGGGGGTDAAVTAVAATATGTAHAPSVVAEAVVSGGGPATATAQAHAPTVTAGAAVTATTATATGQAHAPSITATRTASIAAPAATASATAMPPTVAATRAASITPPPAIATGQAHAPTVQVGGSAAIQAPAATASASAQPPAVHAVQVVTVQAVTATAAGRAHAPTVTGAQHGHANVRPPGATATAWATPPTVHATRHATVSAPKATATARAYAPTFGGAPAITPAHRTHTIAAEARLLTIAADPRTSTIPAETRVLEVT